jgi:hypothetical protein
MTYLGRSKGMETKLTIVSKDGLVGGHYHVLNDKTEKTFFTDSMDEFVRDCNDAVEVCGKLVEVVYDESGATSLPVEVNYYTEALAICKPRTSDRLSIVTGSLGRNMTEAETEAFLRKLSGNLCGDGVSLLANVRHLSLEKVVKYVRQVDTKGNFSFQYTRESSTKQSFEPPEKITVTVPLFVGHKDTVVIPLEVFFEFEEAKDRDGNAFARSKLRFECLDIKEILYQEHRAAIAGYLAKLKCAVRFGKMEIERKTDSWKYLKNPLEIVSE